METDGTDNFSFYLFKAVPKPHVFSARSRRIGSSLNDNCPKIKEGGHQFFETGSGDRYFFMSKGTYFFSLIVFSLVCAANVFAGDVASFVDLGFSEDGKIFMFAQYGVHEGTLKPWAEMRIIDVPLNDFVPNGRFNYTHTDRIAAGQDGSGALFRLIARNAEAIERYAIPFLYQGIPLYISLLNGHTPGGDSIDFRDFEEEVTYTAKIIPYIEGYGETLRSSFFIELHKTDKKRGISKTFTVGTPSVKRNGVQSYSIKKALVAPNRSSMIFVIEMRVQNGNGPDIRYMVETLHF
jgi:predicted secreted protein